MYKIDKKRQLNVYIEPECKTLGSTVLLHRNHEKKSKIVFLNISNYLNYKVCCFCKRFFFSGKINPELSGLVKQNDILIVTLTMIALLGPSPFDIC